MPQPHRPRRFWRLAIVVNLLLVCLLSPAATHAETSISRKVDDTALDFGRGTFVDSTTSQLQILDQPTPDLAGAVQLAFDGNAYAASGLYTSGPYALVYSQAKIREIRWSTLITRTQALQADIALEYRTSSAADCSQPGWVEADWHPLDGAQEPFSSNNQSNAVAIGSTQAHCFQYRAQITSSDRNTTPALLNLSLLVGIPGSPDLKVSAITPRRSANGSQFVGLNVTIINQNIFEPTIPVDATIPGSFYIDLFVFAPGQTVVMPTLPLSDSNKQGSKAYANIDRNRMVPDTPVTIADTEWRDSNTNQSITLTSLFPAQGSYTVIVAVDSYNFVDEGVAGGENNNVSAPVSFSAAPVVSASISWTFMLYLDGDTLGIDSGQVHNDLAKALTRLEREPNSHVRVVALIDGPGAIDTFRVIFTPQAQFQSLGEKRMDEPATLTEFIQQSRRDFPATYYYLAITDHANGVQGTGWDTTTASNRSALLTPGEIRQALKAATNNGASPIDVLHFDGCSFGMLEDATIARGLASYVVASENTTWGIFSYELYRASVGATTTPKDLAQSVARRYAEEVTRRGYPYTISAFDMSRLDRLLGALNTFADSLANLANASQTNRATLATIRKQSQKLESGASPALQITEDDAYVDLVDFATRAKKQISSGGVPAAADQLISTVNGSQPFVIFESHKSGSFDYGGTYTWTLDGAHGVSIYYPRQSSGTTFTNYANGTIFAEFNSLARWRGYLLAGMPPLGSGDNQPEDGLVPLAPLVPSALKIYLPAILR